MADFTLQSKSFPIARQVRRRGLASREHFSRYGVEGNRNASRVAACHSSIILV
jgi:hypothetical protein